MQTTNNQLNSPSTFKWFMIFGVTFLLGGIAVLIVPAAASIAIELLLGWLFFVGGCTQLVAALTVRKNKLFWFKLPWALLFVLVGLWLILRPVEGIQALAFIIGLLFLVEAIMKIVFSWRWRNVSKIGWALLSGILSFVIAMILLTGWPQQSAIFLGILVGINLLVNGMVALLLGFKIMEIENA
ncbi:HdeD family acid-resistance protein [Nitrosomonas sp. Nm132]|jgi:uncharacterized membrane protein HdeD (DUF308 family)|uniref:HdeD family acid-resistance protein n=1 Tax=Nitrosomonas sp. Nm132 TaxID=1881053 RepID=UPI00088D850D|nr:DUF308 domain-containing protein [Nitrosomonas sp. Nm132]SDI02819.1 Uncharacterized membrane protein HdeD, DUF308 family [Nitrosomonas sp. Nm132]